VLLRGCMLRNTEHVYGIVIFTGHENKVDQDGVPAGFYAGGEMHLVASQFRFLDLAVLH
jgi:hypothetical protein